MRLTVLQIKIPRQESAFDVLGIAYPVPLSLGSLPEYALSYWFEVLQSSAHMVHQPLFMAGLSLLDHDISNKCSQLNLLKIVHIQYPDSSFCDTSIMFLAIEKPCGLWSLVKCGGSTLKVRLKGNRDVLAYWFSKASRMLSNSKSNLFTKHIAT